MVLIKKNSDVFTRNPGNEGKNSPAGKAKSNGEEKKQISPASVPP